MNLYVKASPQSNCKVHHKEVLAEPVQTNNLGFTLVELLLSMTLLSLILAAVYSGISSARRISHKGEIKIDRLYQLRVANRFLRKQVQQIGVLSQPDANREVFIGSNNKLVFVANLPGFLTQGGPHLQSLVFEPSEENFVLRFYQHGVAHAKFQEHTSVNTQQIEPVTLLDNIKAGQFLYLRSNQTSTSQDWLTDWSASQQLPDLIRIDVEFVDEVAEVWPLTILPLQPL
ncbi:MAG: prepilin-type N-terminal cleavage/methylation domain-containing protein [Aestuariibacter sp.]